MDISIGNVSVCSTVHTGAVWAYAHVASYHSPPIQILCSVSICTCSLISLPPIQILGGGGGLRRVRFYQGGDQVPFPSPTAKPCFIQEVGETGSSPRIWIMRPNLNSCFDDAPGLISHIRTLFPRGKILSRGDMTPPPPPPPPPNVSLGPASYKWLCHNYWPIGEGGLALLSKNSSCIATGSSMASSLNILLCSGLFVDSDMIILGMHICHISAMLLFEIFWMVPYVHQHGINVPWIASGYMSGYHGS